MNSFFLLPILSCTLALLASGTSMVLFFFLRARTNELTTISAKKEEVASELSSVRDEIRETRNVLRELQETGTAHLGRVSEISGVNMTSQGQVLRLHRRGESVAAISSALKLPVGEVSLIVKVYEMTKVFPMLEKRGVDL